ncbi:MAG: major facilitator superfamily protein [Spirochaetes bacterium]|nr:MAG: major facilitator superfamily protein [Spirochaetota bacterium]
MVRLKTLPRNARTCILVEPLWAFFGPTALFFMPLYQKNLGLSEIQMGIINSVAIASGFVFYSLAAPITNKLGRRKTSLIFDTLSWSMSMLVWAFAQSFVWFLAAAILNSIVRIVFVSWNLLISEDATDAQRSTIFGWINIIGTFGGMTTLVGGLFIDRYGVVPSMRWIFALGSLTMTSMFILRFFGTGETKAGLYLLEKTKNKSLLSLVTQQVPKAFAAIKDPFFLRMIGVYIIANAMQSIDFFRVLYLREEKTLPSILVSSLPALSAGASIFVFFYVVPRQGARKGGDRLAFAFLFCLVAQVLFILMPKGSLLSAILVFPSLQAAYALLATFRDTTFMNGTDSELKSERFSLTQTFMMFFSIPIGWFSGWLYSLSPHAPFIFATLLYALGFGIAKSLKPRIELCAEAQSRIY